MRTEAAPPPAFMARLGYSGSLARNLSFCGLRRLSRLASFGLEPETFDQSPAKAGGGIGA